MQQDHTRLFFYIKLQQDHISNYIKFYLYKTNINEEKFQITIKTKDIKINVSIKLKIK